MKRIVKVESNIKGGCCVGLGERTLILGRNGIGKSTIVAALELALTGRVSDVAGRITLAKEADLMMLAPPGADSLWARAFINGEETAEWTAERGHRATRTGPIGSLPIRDVRDALLGEPDKARKWILRAGGAITWEDIVALVPPSFDGQLRALRDYAVSEGVIDGAAILALAIDTAKRRAREANAQAKAGRSLPVNPGLPPTDTELAELEQVIAAHQNAGNRVALERAQRTLEETYKLIEKSEALEKELLVELGKLQAGGASELTEAALRVAEALAKSNATSCAICGSEVKPEVFATRAARAKARLAAAVEATTQRVKLQGDLSTVRLDMAALRRDAPRVSAEVERLKTLGGGEPPKMPLIEAQAKLRQAHERRASWAAAQRGEESSLQAEREAHEWSQLSDALSRALAVLVDRSRGEFEQKVQRYLPISDSFGVDLIDGEREVLRVGFRRAAKKGSVLHAALSGAEWARMTAALALATGDANAITIVTPEERAFDPDTLSEVLRAFETSPLQVILTSPVAPSDIPRSWTLIDLDRGAPPKPELATSDSNSLFS